MAADDDVESCSSSIGRNSDRDGGSDDGDEAEVQSSYKGPLDTMDALEDSLAIRILPSQITPTAESERTSSPSISGKSLVETGKEVTETWQSQRDPQIPAVLHRDSAPLQVATQGVTATAMEAAKSITTNLSNCPLSINTANLLLRFIPPLRKNGSLVL